MRRSTLHRLLFCCLLALGASFATNAQAQLVVYRLTFEKIGESINFSAYQGGYYVAPVNGGVGTLVLTRTVGGKKFFTYANFGELFIALKDQDRKAVLTATAANTVSTTTFFAIGKTDDTLDAATRFSDQAIVATELRGYAVSADSERDLPFSSSTATDVGVAGACSLVCKLDRGLSEGAIARRLSLDDQVTELTDQLQDQGFAQSNNQTGDSTASNNQNTGNQNTGNQNRGNTTGSGTGGNGNTPVR
jgi:hypothetical protein